MSATPELTADRLRELLSYDPDTGVFRWNRTRGGMRYGEVAGWHGGPGYIQICIDVRPYYGHRLAWLYMTGAFPKEQIDHINRIRDDNRWCNLREATAAQNQGNSIMQSDNKSGYKGVSWNARKKIWCASISISGRTKHLGQFDSIDAARTAYANAAISAFGEFARPT
jgi:hypothetical protein